MKKPSPRNIFNGMAVAAITGGIVYIGMIGTIAAAEALVKTNALTALAVLLVGIVAAPIAANKIFALSMRKFFGFKCFPRVCPPSKKAPVGA